MSILRTDTQPYVTELPEPGMWLIDQGHSTVGFVARHLMISKVRGRFGTFSGSIHIDEDPLDSTVDVIIHAASIDTGNPERDAHLRSGDFLNVETYPFMTFSGRGLAVTGTRSFQLTGHLTIQDVTRPVILDVEFEGVAADAFGNDRVAFTATTAIDRELFHVTWNKALETGGVVVGNRIEIELEIQAVRRAADERAA
jgi:polyisoprenoid-binding protein YceI